MSYISQIISGISAAEDFAKAGAAAAQQKWDQTRTRFLGQNMAFSSGDAKNLIFPSELKVGGAGNRPVIRFTCNDNREGLDNFYNIYLPIPIGISFADSARYDGHELGLLGKIALDAVAGGKSWEDTLKQIGASSSTTMNANRALGMASHIPIPGAGAAVTGIAYANSQTYNKHNLTTFAGHTTRGFSYTFKLIAKTEDESRTVKQIQDVFRTGMYADGTNDQLNTPPKWEIHFIDLSTQRDLDSIPKVYQCFLREMSVTSNASSIIWRTDNSPLEVDIMLSFTETKTLTVQDIVELNARGYTAEMDSRPLREYKRWLGDGPNSGGATTTPTQSNSRIAQSVYNGAAKQFNPKTPTGLTAEGESLRDVPGVENIDANTQVLLPD
jgi:hypothetical protein